ncbi:MAG: hypothetical protein KatS3mg062_0751 [Tepidiforma sp.]|nr:MAG: hypothetical protein KatS3mg062_0751 [Tepidiforma sp.]
MRTVLLPAAAAAAVLAHLAAFAAMKLVPGWDPVLMYPTEHFWVVSAATLLSALVGTGLAISVESVRTTRTVYLALGFIAIALVFATHGLGTPGLIVPATEYPYAVIISAGLSQFIGAVFIAMSVMPRRWPGGEFIQRHSTDVLAVGVAVLTAYLVSMVVRPTLWDFIPRARPWDTALAGATLGLLAVAGWRYYQAWRLTELPGQLAMVTALGLLGVAQFSMYFGELWHLSWWLYHAMLLEAFLVVLGGWAVEAFRAKSLVVFARALELRDSLDSVRSVGDVEVLERLEEAVERKDAYTRHHMGRVAEYAEGIARELGLSERQVLVCAAAGRIHDVGKITVPDAVLLKPDRLTPEEFELMKHHTVRGAHIARLHPELAELAAVIRAHHERFGGGGYPDGLRGDAIPIEARVVAVGDTFDALTSTRVYRPKRPVSEALEELQRVAGTQLDPDCVAAFIRWLERTGRLDAYTAGMRDAAA